VEILHKVNNRTGKITIKSGFRMFSASENLSCHSINHNIRSMHRFT
jgi:hypothetical protein